uniref:Uncharacterized protein n=1 Tax=Sinocyclocheilus anshuiensis TaxID=1608454 RepID=A0A671PRX2_9TELE
GVKGELYDSSTLREEGNNHFKAGDVQQALSCYTKALKISNCQSESAVLYRNRAACYLKLEDCTKAEADATKGKNDIWCFTFITNIMFITLTESCFPFSSFGRRSR